MEVRNLVTFLKVTELKSFSRAAEALDYSQSAVTVQIQQLERELGVQLFDRIGKTVSITQYGKDFVSYARDVVTPSRRYRRLCLVSSELSGTVRVGTLNSLLCLRSATTSCRSTTSVFRRSRPARERSPPSPKCSSRRLDIIYTLDDRSLRLHLCQSLRSAGGRRHRDEHGKPALCPR